MHHFVRRPQSAKQKNSTASGLVPWCFWAQISGAGITVILTSPSLRSWRHWNGISPLGLPSDAHCPWASLPSPHPCSRKHTFFVFRNKARLFSIFQTKLSQSNVSKLLKSLSKGSSSSDLVLPQLSLLRKTAHTSKENLEKSNIQISYFSSPNLSIYILQVSKWMWLSCDTPKD